MGKKKIISIWSSDEKTYCKKTEVEAEQVLTDMFNGRFNFFIHLTAVDDPAYEIYKFSVSEENSGALIACSTTRNKALFHARAILNHQGLERLEKGIEFINKKKRELQKKFHSEETI